MKWILLSTFIFTAAVHAETETLKYPAGNHQSIHIHNSFGNVHVAPSLKKEIVIVANKRKWGSRCLLNIDPQSKQFQIEISDQGWIMDNECRIDLIVSIPEQLKVNLRAGNGNVDIVGTRGDIDVKVGSGKVRIKSDLKSLSALTASGNILFEGRAENTKLTTGHGDIELSIKEKVTGQIIARAGQGDVMISLPENMRVHSQTSTGNGLIRNTFAPAEKNADLDIQASSGQGDVRIREN